MASNSFSLRKASERDVERLSALAYDSEKYWGYDDGFMEKFKLLYNVTKDFIINNPTYILESAGGTIGFFGLIRAGGAWELEFFYLEPSRIGKGYGRVLWRHLLDVCEKEAINEFHFVTSPQAEAFYTKMGARVTGQTESLIRKGRAIPKLKYEINC